MSTSPFLTAGSSGRATPLGDSLRRVDDPAATGRPAPFRDLRGPVGSPAAPNAVPVADAAARELALLKADLAGARANAEAEGRASGRAEAAAAAQLVAKAADALVAAHASLAEADAATLVDLALEIAGTLLGRALRADRAALEATVTRALAAVDAPAPRLRVSPLDAQIAATLVPTNVIVEPDPLLASGEIRVETERAIVDGTAAARLAALREPLIAALEEEAGHAE